MDRNQKNDKIDQNFREIERCLHLYYGEHPEILIGKVFKHPEN